MQLLNYHVVLAECQTKYVEESKPACPKTWTERGIRWDEK